ncbi:hypothetical protein GDO86_007960 [Hymenochirus boettgeri]|uniref:Uncharacterized protein n=1 Tax=Hymenochirus boettgeri TaxID=247094 RepID=A0A8T2J014_9PIPI|nr:hypothetical protein GDO86_007960 [Hymenochirus boettgeri]
MSLSAPSPCPSHSCHNPIVHPQSSCPLSHPPIISSCPKHVPSEPSCPSEPHNSLSAIHRTSSASPSYPSVPIMSTWAPSLLLSASPHSVRASSSPLTCPHHVSNVAPIMSLALPLMSSVPIISLSAHMSLRAPQCPPVPPSMSLSAPSYPQCPHYVPIPHYVSVPPHSLPPCHSCPTWSPIMSLCSPIMSFSAPSYIPQCPIMSPVALICAHSCPPVPHQGAVPPIISLSAPSFHLRVPIMSLSSSHHALESPINVPPVPPHSLSAHHIPRAPHSSAQPVPRIMTPSVPHHVTSLHTSVSCPIMSASSCHRPVPLCSLMFHHPLPRPLPPHSSAQPTIMSLIPSIRSAPSCPPACSPAPSCPSVPHHSPSHSVRAHNHMCPIIPHAHLPHGPIMFGQLPSVPIMSLSVPHNLSAPYACAPIIPSVPHPRSLVLSAPIMSLAPHSAVPNQGPPGSPIMPLFPHSCPLPRAPHVPHHVLSAPFMSL